MSKKRGNGEGCIVKRGEVYYLRKADPVTGKMNARVLYLNGVKCTTEEMARRAADMELAAKRKIDAIETKQEYLLQVAQNRQIIASIKYKVDDIWAEFLSSPLRNRNVSDGRLAEMERVVNVFVGWCHCKDITSMADVTQDAVMRFLDDATRDLSARSYNSYREVLNNVLGKVWRQMGMESNPVEGVPTRKAVTQSRREFTPEQVKAIFDGFDMGFFYEADGQRTQYHPQDEEEFRVLMLLGAFTGCRLKDACLMQWSNVDMERRVITFTPRKTQHSSGMEVSLPIHPMLFSALASINRENEYINPRLAARYGYNPDGISKTIEKLIFCATGLKITADAEKGRARGANQYGMHSFRHTFVSFCGNAGVPMHVVQYIVGHGSPAMTEHYFHANMQSKAKAIEAIQIGPSAPSPREELHGLIDDADETKVLEILKFAKSLI